MKLFQNKTLASITGMLAPFFPITISFLPYLGALITD